MLLLFFSPERSPREILLDLDSTHNIFKDKVPRAKEEMEEKLQVESVVWCGACACVCNYICVQLHVCAITCVCVCDNKRKSIPSIVHCAGISFEVL